MHEQLFGETIDCVAFVSWLRTAQSMEFQKHRHIYRFAISCGVESTVDMRHAKQTRI